jgi:hypothetical protein
MKLSSCEECYGCEASTILSSLGSQSKQAGDEGRCSRQDEVCDRTVTAKRQDVMSV